MSVVRSEPAALRRRMGWPSLTRIALDDHWPPPPAQPNAVAAAARVEAMATHLPAPPAG